MNYLKNKNGQGLTEYLILLILISVVCIAAARTLGSTVKKKIQLASDHIKKDVTITEKKGGILPDIGDIFGSDDD